VELRVQLESSGTLLSAAAGPGSLRQGRAGKGSNRLSAHLPTGTPACPRRKPDAEFCRKDAGEWRTPTPHAAAHALGPVQAHGKIHVVERRTPIAPKSMGFFPSIFSRACSLRNARTLENRIFCGAVSHLSLLRKQYRAPSCVSAHSATPYPLNKALITIYCTYNIVASRSTVRR
jgi:hypothetical protein